MEGHVVGAGGGDFHLPKEEEGSCNGEVCWCNWSPGNQGFIGEAEACDSNCIEWM